jgi:uncharacterized small protein (DUF1192 family)
MAQARLRSYVAAEIQKQRANDIDPHVRDIYAVLGDCLLALQGMDKRLTTLRADLNQLKAERHAKADQAESGEDGEAADPD